MFAIGRYADLQCDYIRYDDDVACVASATDPAGFVAGLSEHVILDEIQRVPELLTALKLEIDRRLGRRRIQDTAWRTC